MPKKDDFPFPESKGVIWISTDKLEAEEQQRRCDEYVQKHIDALNKMKADPLRALFAKVEDWYG